MWLNTEMKHMICVRDKTLHSWKGAGECQICCVEGYFYVCNALDISSPDTHPDDTNRWLIEVWTLTFDMPGMPMHAEMPESLKILQRKLICIMHSAKSHHEAMWIIESDSEVVPLLVAWAMCWFLQFQNEDLSQKGYILLILLWRKIYE